MNYLNLNASTAVYGLYKDLFINEKDEKLFEEMNYSYKRVKYYIERNYPNSYFLKKVINDISENDLKANNYRLFYFSKDKYVLFIFIHLENKTVKPSFVLMDNNKNSIFTSIQDDILDKPKIDYFLENSTVKNRDEFILECLSYLW